MTLLKNSRGQISIFFSASLVVFISIIAFVINVGLFVKAKINLQNATDAAAFAGAAVQARQLTKIAYLNWEMRNIYKEWMYKYYVVGSINSPMVEDPGSSGLSCEGGKECMDFRMAESVNAITGAATSDSYNFPATCIHLAESNTNICKRFAVPGLPEFGGLSLPGAEEASRSFMDTLVGEKMNNCVDRSQLNMMVNASWAYNVLSDGQGDTLAGRGPAILSNRQGAWPRAVELAMRIRNLEKVVNREAITNGVCYGASGSGISCKPITDYENAPVLGNERIVKAFYSGWRNLGSANDREMKDTFTIHEISPKIPIRGSQSNNSNLLIPEIYDKQFLDLKLMMVNYATFYAALIPNSTKQASGACDISKVAIPVPGYPLGFYKNPEVLTYYAIKGEAEFVGMFNPFAEERVRLTAYSAAKPFGGRIGPMLFTQKTDDDYIRGRNDEKMRSIPYISSLDVTNTPNKFLQPPAKLQRGEYGPGAPLPINLNNSFWLEQPDSPVGGRAPSGQNVQFGIPNLVYDFIGGMNDNEYSVKTEKLHFIRSADAPSKYKAVGLFNYKQFKKFRGDIGGNITAERLEDEIARVRAPTSYEAANYLIPTPSDFNSHPRIAVDSFGAIAGNGIPLNNLPHIKKYFADIYAPLWGSEPQDLLYKSPSDIISNIADFMREQREGIKNYTFSLNKAAIEVYNMGARATVAAQGVDLKTPAKKISDISDTNLAQGKFENVYPETCDSLAGAFYYFYYGGTALNIYDNRLANLDVNKCPIPLGDQLLKYFNGQAGDTSYNPNFYRMEYSLDDSLDTKVFSAYTPGPYNGVNQDGNFVPPFPDPELKPELMRRNFYSTKFVTLDSLRESGHYNEQYNFVIHSEGDLTTNSEFDVAQKIFQNPLDEGKLGSDADSIKY
jgi:hypothetical protein